MLKTVCSDSEKALLVSVCILENNEVITFAADELKRYLKAVTGCDTKVIQRKEFASLNNTLWLGTLKSFPFINIEVSEKHHLDEGIYIDTYGASGIICGFNAGSVLLAVYRYLTELGCRWVRPGNAGELLPDIDITSKKIRIFEKPSYRYRGICAEGAVSCENLINMIDWMPKVGFNCFFMHFGEEYLSLHLSYGYLWDSLINKKNSFSDYSANEYASIIDCETRKRGLLNSGIVNDRYIMSLGSSIKDLLNIFKAEGINVNSYYLCNHNYDPGGLAAGKIIYEEISKPVNSVFKGFISCQVQRTFFPNGLGMTVMGRKLWNSELDFEHITYDYYKSTYGDEWYECLSYLQRLSELFGGLMLGNKEIVYHKDRIEICEEIIKHLYQFKPVIEKNISNSAELSSMSWKYLYIHSQIWMELTRALKAFYRNDAQTAKRYWTYLKYKLWGNEMQYRDVLDVLNFVRAFDSIFLL